MLQKYFFFGERIDLNCVVGPLSVDYTLIHVLLLLCFASHDADVRICWCFVFGLKLFTWTTVKSLYYTLCKQLWRSVWTHYERVGTFSLHTWCQCIWLLLYIFLGLLFLFCVNVIVNFFCRLWNFISLSFFQSSHYADLICDISGSNSTKDI